MLWVFERVGETVQHIEETFAVRVIVAGGAIAVAAIARCPRVEDAKTDGYPRDCEFAFRVGTELRVRGG